MYDDTDFYKKTVYRKDFRGMQAVRRSLATFEPEYPETIAGPYYRYLVPENYKKRLPRSITYEHHDDVIQRIVERRPHLKCYFVDDPTNLDIIANRYNYDNRTMYQAMHCDLNDLDGSYSSRVSLPRDYVVPPTTQRASYRNPHCSAIPLDLQPKKAKAPINNLEICEITRRVMQVETGESEYGGVIGYLGNRILKEEYLGKRMRTKRPNNWEIQTSMVEFLPKKQDEGLCWKATQTSKRKKA